MFLLSIKACFVLRPAPNSFFYVFCIKRKVKKISNFQLKPLIDKHLWKHANFWRCLNRCFYSPEMLDCCIKRRRLQWLKGVTGFARGYRGLPGIRGGYKRLHGATRGYRGLQGVTVGYKGLHGVTKGYRGLQMATGDYKGLQGVTKGYRGLQGDTGGYRGLQGVTRGFRGYKGLQGLQGVTGGYKRLQGVTEGYKRLQVVRRVYMGLQRIIEPFFVARMSFNSFSCFFFA